MKKRSVLLILCLFLIGCSTTTNLKLIDPTGRELPKPHYVLKSFYGSITATFYYASLSEIKDVDGTIISKPNYLSMYPTHTIKPTDTMMLVIEVSNPHKIEYEVWEDVTIKQKENGVKVIGAELASSKLAYRQFLLAMPNSDEVEEVIYRAKIFEPRSSMPIIRFGTFHYKIKKEREVVRTNSEIVF